MGNTAVATSVFGPKFRIIAILLVVVMLLTIIWQNSVPTTLVLLIFRAELPLMLWLAVFLLVGILIGAALTWSWRRRA
ncbi:MAG: LapA family protein [Dokdonella sp.]